MQNVKDLFREIQKEFGELVMFPPWGIRGAQLMSGDYVTDQKLAVYAVEEFHPGAYHYEPELEVVRAGLANVGVMEVGSYLSDSAGYIVVAQPFDPWEVDRTQEFEDLTPKGRVRRNLHLKRLTDLAWHAWAVANDVSLRPGDEPSPDDPERDDQCSDDA